MSTKVISSIMVSTGLVQGGSSIDSTADGQALIRTAGSLTFRALTTTDIPGIATGYAPISHTHTTSQITDFTTAVQTVGDARYVRGPSSATANAIARFDSTTGKLIQNSTILVDDNGIVTQNYLSTFTSGTGLVSEILVSSTGTAIQGFGTFDQMKMEVTGGTLEIAAQTVTAWIDASATFRARRIFNIGRSSGAVEAFRIEAATTTAGMIGFLGATASPRLVSPDAGTALVTFGLASGTPTFAWANITGVPALGAGSVTSVSVVSANGFAGTVANASSTPAITITTTVTGLLKGNGTAISAATAGTDYVVPSALSSYQPLDGDLTALSALVGTNTIYYRSAADTWTPVAFFGLTFVSGLLSATATVQSVGVVSANGFAGTVNNATTTPTITLTTTVTGMLKGNGTAISAAVAGTDYAAASHTHTASQITDFTTAVQTVGDARYSVLAHTHTGVYQPLDGDLTAIAALTGTNTIYYRSAADTWTPVTVGSNMTFSGGTLNAVAGGDVVGPTGATADAISIYNSTTGKIIKNSTATIAGNGLLTVNSVGGNTTTPQDTFWLQTTTSGTAAAGYGLRVRFASEDAGGSVTSQGYMDAVWTDATNKVSRISTFVTDGTGANPEAIRFEGRGFGAGAGARIGFFGATAAIQQNGEVGGALVAYGLLTGTPTYQWTYIFNKPTTLAGYGITDAAAISHTHTASQITDFAAAVQVVGDPLYQPGDGDLTSIAALSGIGIIPCRTGINTWSALTIGTGLSLTGGNTLSVTTGTYAPFSHTHTASQITDFTTAVQVIGDARYSLLSHNHDSVYAPIAHTHTFASLTSKPTTLSGYGITDGQPLDADLTALAALTGTNTIYYRSAADTWTPVNVSTGLTFTGGNLVATGGGGGGDDTLTWLGW